MPRIHSINFLSFIVTGTGLATVLGSSAMAGDSIRFDVDFNDIDVFFIDFAAGEVPDNVQDVDTSEPGRYFASLGWSNVDVDVCWNSGVNYTGWASEVVFDIQMNDGAGTSWFVASPFAGDDTGSGVEGTCSNRQALGEFEQSLPGFTYSVDGSGTVRTGMSATWNDGLGVRHSEVNTADFYFMLGAVVPKGCNGATGSCGVTHLDPGCDDITCCSSVCDPDQGGDPFCCESTWDSACVDIAVDICGIFQYSCKAPAYPNDCASSPMMLSNGDTVAFDTTGANTDGPEEVGCQSANDDLPIWSDLWYQVNIDVDSNLTATCCNLASYDSTIAIYDAGPTGSTFEPETLPEAFLVCNEDCSDDSTFFTSEASTDVLAGNSYLIRVGGWMGDTGTGDLVVSWEEPVPKLPDPACDTPGGTTISQITTNDENLTISGGVWCGAAAENVLARSYPAAAFGGAFDVSCVNFGWFMNDADSYMPCIINLYKQNAASPLAVTSQELVGTTQCGLRGAAEYTFSSQSFETPVTVDLADGEFLMVEVRYQRQLQEGGFDAYGGFFGVILADTDGSESYISCGGDYFGSMTDIGFGDYQAYITLNGWRSCAGDFDDNGVVRSPDLGRLLAAWGDCEGCPEDLDGDGQVDASDLGILVANWGPCP